MEFSFQLLLRTLLSLPPLGPVSQCAPIACRGRVSQSAPLGLVSQSAPLGPVSQSAPLGPVSQSAPLGLSLSLPRSDLFLSRSPWGLSLSLPRSDLFLSLPRWVLSLRPWSSRQSMCSTHWSSVVPPAQPSKQKKKKKSRWTPRPTGHVLTAFSSHQTVTAGR